MKFNRDISFEEYGLIYDTYKTTYKNGYYKLVTVTNTKPNRTELVEFYDNYGWLIKFNEY